MQKEIQRKIFGITLGILLLPSFLIGSCVSAVSNMNDSPADGVYHEVGPQNLKDFPPDVFYNGIVTKVLDKNDKDYVESSEIVQKLRVRIRNGEKKGIEVATENNIPSNAKDGMKLKVGDAVVVVETYGVDGRRYYVVDTYRLPSIVLLACIFVAIIVFFGKLRGVSSILGLIFSIGVIAKFIVPQILHGRDPLLISIIGCLLIASVSLYLAHGFNKRTSISLLSTFITLGISAACSVAFVHFAKLFGTGTEDALYLQINQADAINLKGLLLGGIIIGIMGILDDVTTAQTAAVEEIRNANPLLSSRELYTRGLSVGKEHISSLVNTLALAYAGVSLPLFLLFILNKGQPLWVVVNGENIAEEIIRTLVGSVVLIIAVPISTYLAAYFFRPKHENSKISLWRGW